METPQRLVERVESQAFPYSLAVSRCIRTYDGKIFEFEAPWDGKGDGELLSDPNPGLSPFDFIATVNAKASHLDPTDRMHYIESCYLVCVEMAISSQSTDLLYASLSLAGTVSQRGILHGLETILDAANDHEIKALTFFDYFCRILERREDWEGILESMHGTAARHYPTFRTGVSQLGAYEHARKLYVNKRSALMSVLEELRNDDSHGGKHTILAVLSETRNMQRYARELESCLGIIAETIGYNQTSGEPQTHNEPLVIMEQRNFSKEQTMMGWAKRELELMNLYPGSFRQHLALERAVAKEEFEEAHAITQLLATDANEKKNPSSNLQGDHH